MIEILDEDRESLVEAMQGHTQWCDFQYMSDVQSDGKTCGHCLYADIGFCTYADCYPSEMANRRAVSR